EIGDDYDLDPAVALRELPGVLQQVFQNLSQTGTVAVHPDGDLGKPGLDRDARVLKDFALVFRGEPGETRQVGSLPVQVDRATRDPRYVHEIVDEPSHVRDLTVHHVANESDHRRVVTSKVKQVDRVSQRRQGVPQLVCQHAQELVFAVGGLTDFLQQSRILLFGPLAFGDVAGDLRGHEDLPRRIADRRDRKRNVDGPPVLGSPYRFIVLDSLSLRKLLEYPHHVVGLARDQ